MTLTTWDLVAETKEWVGPITVTVNDVVVTDFLVCVMDGQARPTGWAAADYDPDHPGETAGVLVGTGTPWTLIAGHVYTIFVKYVDNPEAPVLRAGRISAT